jgi:hypothetical protein
VNHSHESVTEERGGEVRCRNGDCKGCPVEGTPYTRSGVFRPVKLNACKCTMSELAARSSAEAGKCKICYKLLKSDKGFAEDETVRRTSLVQIHPLLCSL